jgi:hypothetical protein
MGGIGPKPSVMDLCEFGSNKPTNGTPKLVIGLSKDNKILVR